MCTEGCHSNLLVAILVCQFLETEGLGKPYLLYLPGTWRLGLEMILFSCSKPLIKHNTILDFHLSIHHLLILLPPSFHLSLILTQIREVRFKYYASQVPTRIIQEILAFLSVFIRFSLCYRHLLHFNIHWTFPCHPAF